jgi:hypothetical protein
VSVDDTTPMTTGQEMMTKIVRERTAGAGLLAQLGVLRYWQAQAKLCCRLKFLVCKCTSRETRNSREKCSTAWPSAGPDPSLGRGGMYVCMFIIEY